MLYRTRWLGVSLGCLTLLMGNVSAQTTSSLRQALEDVDVGDRWSYNDWESAKSAASKSKKPILALFR